MNQSHIIKKTVEQLKKTNPYKIILFGSRTSSSANEESDFDFIVVTSDDFIPKNFNEKTKLFLKINNSIKNIKKEAPIDLIVYTRPLFNKFLEQKSLFSQEIEITCDQWLMISDQTTDFVRHNEVKEENQPLNTKHPKPY